MPPLPPTLKNNAFLGTQVANPAPIPTIQAAAGLPPTVPPPVVPVSAPIVPNALPMSGSVVKNPMVLTSGPAETKVNQMTQTVLTADQQMADAAAKEKARLEAAGAATAGKQWATLHGPNNQAVVVEVGSGRAAELQGQGWGLSSYTPPTTAAPTTTPTTHGQFVLTNSAGGSMPFNSKEERDAYYNANAGYWNKPADLQAEEDAKMASDFEANVAKRESETQAEYDRVSSQMNQILNGTFPMSPEEQQTILDIQQQYASLISEQREANESFENAVRLTGERSGRSLYAPGVQQGNIASAVNAGLKEISNLNRQMNSAISQAKAAIKEGNLRNLALQHDLFQDLQASKSEEIERLYRASRDAIEDARNAHRDELETQKFNLEIETLKNKPLLEADARLKDYLYEQMTRFPDAGIDASDTVQSAVDKIKASPTYIASREQDAADLAYKQAQTGASNRSNQPKASSSGGGGGGGSRSGGAIPVTPGQAANLSATAQAVVDNPALLSNFTPTERGKIITEIASAGIDTTSLTVPKITPAQTKVITDYDDAARRAEEALNFITTTGIDTGPVASRIKAGQAIIGGAPEFTQLRAAIDQLSSSIINALSGANVPPAEFARMRGFIPSINDDEKTLVLKLNSLKAEMEKSKSNFISRATQTSSQTIAGNARTYTVTSKDGKTTKTGTMTAAEAEQARKEGYTVK